MAIDWDAAVLVPVMGVFGEPVTYAPAVGPSFVVSGVFDEAYHEIDLVEGAPVNTVIPLLGIRLADFPVPPQQGESLTIQRTGTSYVVRDVRVDGHGGAKLLLNWSSG